MKPYTFLTQIFDYVNGREVFNTSLSFTVSDKNTFKVNKILQIQSAIKDFQLSLIQYLESQLITVSQIKFISIYVKNDKKNKNNLDTIQITINNDLLLETSLFNLINSNITGLESLDILGIDNGENSTIEILIGVL